jgi:hypothetical protein
MSELAIELPNNLTKEQQAEIVASLREIDEVEQAENLGPSRSPDMATISVGVQLATQVGSLIAPVVEKIIGVIRGRQIKGVKIVFPGGTSIAVDEISGKDLKQLLELVANSGRG